MMSTIQVSEWLESLPRNADVGIDEGGLCLWVFVNEEPTGAYLEIGGIPEEMEEKL